MRADLVIVAPTATLAGKDGFGWVEAIAIQGGRVVAAGTELRVSALADAGTVTWRPGTGYSVLPGITDAHLHFASAARSSRHLDLGDVTGRDAILTRIGERHRAMEASGEVGWLEGHGWSVDRYGGWPTADDLEGVAPGRRVALWSHDHHGLWTSAAGLLAADVGRETPDPAGGLIRRDVAGAATGMLHEHASGLLTPSVARPPPGDLARAMRDYGAQLAALGVTGAQDPGELTPDPELRWGPSLYRSLAKAGELPIRICGSIRHEQLARAIELGFVSGDAVTPADSADPAAVLAAARYRGGWLKLFADGALGSRSAALLEPYELEPDGPYPVGGPRGMLLQPVEALREVAARAAAAAIAVQIHGIGDAAVRAALDVLGTLPRPGSGFSHRIEHAQLVHHADVPRFATTGVVASVQASHLVSDALAARAAWGARTEGAFPLGFILATGGVLALGTDAPVETPNPWAGIAAAVTRAGAEWDASEPAFHPQEAISLAQALRAACIGPPWSAGEEDRGRLVPGQVADLVVVRAETFAEPVTRTAGLSATRPVATLVDGAVAYMDGSFDPRT